MTPAVHGLLVKFGYGVLMGIAPAIGIDVHTLYNWTQQDKQTFLQMFSWQVSLKRLIAGVISGGFGAIGWSLFGVNL